MEHQLPQKWIKNLEILDIAFQPILNIHTGRIFAVETLLRNYKDIGYKSIFDLFDDVYKQNYLYSFDLALRKKTLKKFMKIKVYKDIKLFYNLDNRLTQMNNFYAGNTNKLLKELNLSKDAICFEISERHDLCGMQDMKSVMQHYKDDNYSIAIDNFGVGYSGYKLLYDVQPDILKIDRFLLTNIQNYPKKKIMLRSIIQLAIQLGIQIVAEGIETKEELLLCRDIGCHLIQGYFIQVPTTNVKNILLAYEHIAAILKDNGRDKNNRKQIENYIEKLNTLNIKIKITSVIEYFQKNRDTTVLPIVNSLNEPVGILQDNQIKDFLYSPFGRALLINDDSKKSKLKNLITSCGISDINSDMSIIIELFSNNPNSVGILLTKNSKYYGFLSARSIITIMNEQNLLYAREQNPLTKLPGNTMIEKYITKTSESNDSFVLCYFDLDNFKAFNDVYGFRNGDRVIQLFADILKKSLPSQYFKAHIGGDDFFTATEYDTDDKFEYINAINKIIKKFTDDVMQFYSKEDRENQYISSKDREGNEKKFPLLTVSASVVIIDKKTKNRLLTDINSILSLQKKVAKGEANHMSISSML